ncbi:MAG: inositol transport system ATP-binding protein [Halanaerobiales bacterium]|nr:inositol transport system ATP-binding protein [Halanaerobiales bacterium]
MSVALEMRNITKRFPGVLALDSVNLLVEEGEIHAVVGENGAGKSTLMKILAGAYQKDAGQIFVRGKEVEITNTIDAQKQGIGMIYQEFNLIPHLSVAENIFLGRFPLTKSKKIKFDELNKMAQQYLKELETDISPQSIVGELSVADRQLVEIAKALSLNSSVLVMDEPTSSLSPGETEVLFGIMRKLKESGVSIIFISHHMDEIFSIADRVTVLRDGKYIGSWPISELNEEILVQKMVGRQMSDMFPKIEAEIGETILEVRNLTVPGYVSDVSFELRAGEILGIGGLVGAGRTELVNAIFGAIPTSEGEIFINGSRVAINHPQEAVENGIALIPEDRGQQGLVLKFSVKENITLPNLKRFVKRIEINTDQEEALADELVERFSIKTPSLAQLAENLSGGNQQKVVLAKWLGMKPKILILDEPTRGIDVGAKAEIHKLIGKLAAEGIGIIMVSSELPELLGVSDRILVMCRGEKTGEFTREEATSEKIMMAATGAIEMGVN